MDNQPPEARNYFLACYPVSLIQGRTILGTPIRYKTVVYYLREAYRIVEENDNHFSFKEDYINVILKTFKIYDSVSNRRNMITDPMVRWFVKEEKLHSHHSITAVLCDWILLGRYTGFRLSEWCQTSQDKYAQLPWQETRIKPSQEMTSNF